MEAIWAYRDWTGVRMDSGAARCDLKEFPLETFSFVASLFSFIRYAPSTKRVIYCDQSVYNFLEETGIYKLLDCVHLTSFEDKIDKLYSGLGHFFAYPKIWAYTQMEEPGFIVDTDLILKQPISEWLKPDEYYLYRYFGESANRLPFNSSQKEIEALVQGVKCSPSFRSFANYENTCNAGLIYFADSKVANIVGHTLLSMGVELQSYLDKEYPEGDLSKSLCWTLYEESPMINLIQTVIQKPVQEFPLKAYEEISVDWNSTVTLGDQEGVVNRLIQELGFNSLHQIWNRIKVGKKGILV